jgi:hypothetical protein
MPSIHPSGVGHFLCCQFSQRGGQASCVSELSHEGKSQDTSLLPCDRVDENQGRQGEANTLPEPSMDGWCCVAVHGERMETSQRILIATKKHFVEEMSLTSMRGVRPRTRPCVVVQALRQLGRHPWQQREVNATTWRGRAAGRAQVQRKKCRKMQKNVRESPLKIGSVRVTTSCFPPNFTMAGALVAGMLRGVAGGAVRGARLVRHLSTSSSSVAEMTEKLKACSTQVSA